MAQHSHPIGCVGCRPTVDSLNLEMLKMRLVQLSDGRWIAVDQIEELRINQSSQTITVRMKNGIGYSHHPEYKQSIYEALDQLAAKVNAD